MNPIASIVAATDLSAPARHAADRAARLAHEAHAALTLVHVFPGGTLQSLRAWLGTAAADRLEDEACHGLEDLARELRGAVHGPVQSLCVSGQVLDEIRNAAEDRAADLLVLGARGEGFLRRLVLGTTSERLLRRTTVPILVVRQTPHERYRRVLVAVDFSPWSVHATRLASRVAPHARLMLFHAWRVPFEDKLHFAGVQESTIEHYRLRAREQATQKVLGLAQEIGLKPGTWDALVVEGEASQRLIEQEQAHGCDLVVLGKHGQSAAEDLLLGSVTKHVLAEGCADVLVSTTHDEA